LLGGTLPTPVGWVLGLSAVPVVWAVDTAQKWFGHRGH
jgi:hypothetical protein